MTTAMTAETPTSKPINEHLAAANRDTPLGIGGVDPDDDRVAPQAFQAMVDATRHVRSTLEHTAAYAAHDVVGAIEHTVESLEHITDRVVAYAGDYCATAKQHVITGGQLLDEACAHFNSARRRLELAEK